MRNIEAIDAWQLKSDEWSEVGRLTETLPAQLMSAWNKPWPSGNCCGRRGPSHLSSTSVETFRRDP